MQNQMIIVNSIPVYICKIMSSTNEQTTIDRAHIHNGLRLLLLLYMLNPRKSGKSIVAYCKIVPIRPNSTNLLSTPLSVVSNNTCICMVDRTFYP